MHALLMYKLPHRGLREICSPPPKPSSLHPRRLMLLLPISTHSFLVCWDFNSKVWAGILGLKQIDGLLSVSANAAVPPSEERGPQQNLEGNFEPHMADTRTFFQIFMWLSCQPKWKWPLEVAMVVSWSKQEVESGFGGHAVVVAAVDKALLDL